MGPTSHGADDGADRGTVRRVIADALRFAPASDTEAIERAALTVVADLRAREGEQAVEAEVAAAIRSVLSDAVRARATAPRTRDEDDAVDSRRAALRASAAALVAAMPLRERPTSRPVVITRSEAETPTAEVVDLRVAARRRRQRAVRPLR